VADYVKTKHDIGLLRADGSTQVGLRLARDKSGNPIYRAADDEYLAQQFYSGDPSYNNLPPEKELSIRQDDWRTGFGLEVYDALDPKRYFSSIGMDMRFTGMAVAGPVATPLIETIIAPIVDGDMELKSAAWQNESAWAGGGAQRSGNWCLRVNNKEAYQDIAWDAAYQGKTYHLEGWINVSAATTGRIGINDGVGTTYSGYHTGGGTYERFTVSRTLDGAATRLRIILASDTVNNADFDDCAAPTAGYPAAFTDFNDELYVGIGTSLFKLNATGDGLALVKIMPAAITDLEPFTDDALYLCLGTSDKYWAMSTAEVFTESSKVATDFELFQRVDAAVPTMWGVDGVNTIRSTAHPANGGDEWGNQEVIDTSYHSITDLVSKSGELYIMKEDMPYYINSEGAIQNDLAPELSSALASTSGKNSFPWKNKLYIPFGTQGLLETDGTTNTFLNPSSYCTNLPDFVGRIFAVAADEEWLFVAIDNSTKVEIVAGREETIAGTTSWVWHPINELTLAGCETLYTSSVYQKRLWIGSTSTSDSLYYIPLPTGYGNLEADVNRSFKTNSYMITPWMHGNFRADAKAFIKLFGELGHNYDADIYFECHYQILGDTDWTDAGDMKGTATNRTATLYIPADSGSNNPVSEMIRFKFVAKTDDVQKTPVLLGYDCRGILYPENRRIIECEVLCDDEMTLNDSTIEKGQAATIKAALEEARNANWPVTFYDINESTIFVKFLPLRMVVTKKEKGRGIERHYLLQLEEVALS
tara:strand:- start:5040 stop:7319 length:2280 start_codon:yes stop_codon:yes gene_type:complete